jgi:hypothetical protein
VDEKPFRIGQQRLLGAAPLGQRDAGAATAALKASAANASLKPWIMTLLLP